MPYTLALDDPPPLPSSQVKLANSDGTPSREFWTWMSATQDWIERAQAALKEVEPP